MTTRPPVNLVADYPEIADLWVRGLRFLLYVNKKMMSQPDEQTWITDYFNAADTSMDGQLEFEEVWKLLQRMSVKMTRKQARFKFNVSNIFGRKCSPHVGSINRVC